MKSRGGLKIGIDFSFMRSEDRFVTMGGEVIGEAVAGGSIQFNEKGRIIVELMLDPPVIVRGLP